MKSPFPVEVDLVLEEHFLLTLPVQLELFHLLQSEMVTIRHHRFHSLHLDVIYHREQWF